MRHFSILQHATSIVLDDKPDAKPIGLAFSEDPNDSSLVRLRVATSDSENAVEIVFDRNGRERSRRLWPAKYPAWSDKEPAVLDQEAAEAVEKIDAAIEADAKETSDTEKPASRGKGKAK